MPRTRNDKDVKAHGNDSESRNEDKVIKSGGD